MFYNKFHCRVSFHWFTRADWVTSQKIHWIQWRVAVKRSVTCLWKLGNFHDLNNSNRPNFALITFNFVQIDEELRILSIGEWFWTMKFKRPLCYFNGHRGAMNCLNFSPMDKIHNPLSTWTKLNTIRVKVGPLLAIKSWKFPGFHKHVTLLLKATSHWIQCIFMCHYSSSSGESMKWHTTMKFLVQHHNTIRFLYLTCTCWKLSRFQLGIS